MRLKPLDERVVVKMVEPVEETESGIILTGDAKKEPEIAEVLAIGPEIDSDDGVEVGCHVVFASYSGSKVTLDGEEYIILDLEDILAVIEDYYG